MVIEAPVPAGYTFVQGRRPLRSVGLASYRSRVGGALARWQGPWSGSFNELDGESTGFGIAGEWPVEGPELGVESLGENDIGGVVGALALKLLGHRDDDGRILELVKDDRDCGNSLAGSWHVGGGELASGYCSCEGTGSLIGQERGRVEILALLLPCAQ